MEEEKVDKRPARKRKAKPAGRKAIHGQVKAVGLDEESFQQLQSAAADLKMSKVVFASAAVKFFTSQGIDPTQPRKITLPEIAQQLAQLSTQVGTMQETARKQSADIGNRVVGMWRTLEKNLYNHLGGEQMATLTYLESIEENLLERVATSESQYLWPMMEHVLRLVAEVSLNRQISSDIMEIQKDPRVTTSVRQMSNKSYEDQIVEEVIAAARQILAGMKLTGQKKSKRPGITNPPTSALPPPKVQTPPVAPAVQP